MPHPANPENKLQLNINELVRLNCHWKYKYMYCTLAMLSYPTVYTALHIRKHAVNYRLKSTVPESIY